MNFLLFIHFLYLFTFLSRKLASNLDDSLWSDPKTWPDNTLPTANQEIIISKNAKVILDISTPPLGIIY